jgi:hypothetical protein
MDGVSKKIYSFNCNWNDNVVFESPTGAMSAEEAIDKYLSKDGFDLKYEINTLQSYDPKDPKQEPMVDITDAYSVNYEVRLVYRPDINPSYISPFTGEQLNSNGEVYKKTAPYVYVDVPDIEGNREILLLSDMNIGFEGDHFYPGNNITQGQLNDIMQKIGYGYGNNEVSSENEDKYITREALAYNFITYLGLEKVAGLSDIYKTGVIDENVIDQKYLGAVALAKGLGLMDADANNRFNPKDNVTRAQAVHLILQFINIQQKGILY